MLLRDIPLCYQGGKKNTNSVVRKKVNKLCSLSSLVMLLERKLFVQALYVLLHGQLGGKNEGNFQKLFPGTLQHL